MTVSVDGVPLEVQTWHIVVAAFVAWYAIIGLIIKKRLDAGRYDWLDGNKYPPRFLVVFVMWVLSPVVFGLDMLSLGMISALSNRKEA